MKIWTLFPIVIFLGFVSCAKSPPEVVKTPEVAPIVQIEPAQNPEPPQAIAQEDTAKNTTPLPDKELEDAQKALDEAVARMQRSRRQAVNADGETHFPNDWRVAETGNQNARNARRETTSEIKIAAALYMSAADAYDEIVRKNTARLADDTQRAR